MVKADFSGARIREVIFANNDLSKTLNLDKAIHYAPSTIGKDTISASKGKIPDAFLRGCGFSNWQIELAKLHNPDLSNEDIVKVQYRIYDLRAIQALQIFPCLFLILMQMGHL